MSLFKESLKEIFTEPIYYIYIILCLAVIGMSILLEYYPVIVGASIGLLLGLSAIIVLTYFDNKKGV